MTTPSRRAAQKGRPGVRPRRVPPRKSFLERNRGRLMVAALGVALLAVGAFAFFTTSTAGYSCASLWKPGATPTTAPSAIPNLGYFQDDMGHNHVGVGAPVKYTFCPPASGNHYNAAGVAGPIPARLYGPNEKKIPQNWLHNLEHGALVLLYKCGGASDPCSADAQQALGALVANFPISPICKTSPGTLSPVIARFDDMDIPYAALVWDEVLPLQTLDLEQIKVFFLQHAEQLNPEKLCALPSPTPGPSATPAPSSTPSAAPSGGPSTQPSASVQPS
ncbi:MAG TPA: DUF3105 domain-containing protein [Candidatus Limnocylindrales bacterium]|nr:DUF3105 domain-containing protein [Candidatus Limnocylindrales bacterium]